MKRILVLGAGLVSKPGVRYLLEQPDNFVTVASRTVSKAEKLVEGYENGAAFPLNVKDDKKLSQFISENDVVVSLLPWIHHVKVAKLCLELGKNMVTTSYVSGEMKDLDADVKSNNLLFLNEIGVDPGIDHMSAMKIIDSVESEGGKILHFYSFCGGLPAPEDNDNPFGYKFSWSPKGVVLASQNSAHYLKDGEIIDIDGKDLFLNYHIEEVDGLGKFEVYPNRDSLPYKDLYSLNDALTVMRGTYRNLGWCDTIKAIVDLGLLDDSSRENLKGMTYRQMMKDLLKTDEDVLQAASKRLGISADSDIIKRIDWLGFFSDDLIPDCDNYLDILSERMQEKLFFKDGEKDMLLLKHTFIVENHDGSKDMITSTLIDYGIPFGDSSMARTVSLPLAVGVNFILQGQFKQKGIQIPNTEEIYIPILEELERLGIKMVEKRTRIE